MVTKKLVKTLLYLHPNIDSLFKKLEKQLSLLCSFGFISNNTYAVEILVDKILTAQARLDTAKLIDNVIGTACNLLDRIDKEIIKEYYFDGTCIEDIAKRMDKYPTFILYRKERALKKLAQYMYILGINRELIIQYFDDESMMIDCAIRAEGDK